MLNKQHLLILISLLVYTSLKPLTKSSVTINKTQYSYILLNKNQADKIHYYKIDFCFPVITYIGKDTINETTVFLRPQKADAAIFAS